MRDELSDLMRFLYACPVGLLEISLDGGIGMMNPLAMQVLIPLAKSGMVENFFTVTESCSPELSFLVQTFSAARGTVCDSHRMLVDAGTRENGFRANVLACTIVKLESDRFVVTVSDVSTEVARERRLKQAEAWISQLVDDIQDFAVLWTDGNGQIDYVSPSSTRQTGYTPADLLGRSPECFETADAGTGSMSFRERLACARRDGWHLSEGWSQRKNGERYWCQQLIATRGDADGAAGGEVPGYLLVLRDVSPNHSNSGQLADLLRKDYLTGACNRAYFFSVAERECRRAAEAGQPLSLIAVDLDRFKSVNDTYGHAAGDEVLKLFTKVSTELLRPVDLLARLGGEEFAILLPGSTLGGAMQTAERLRANLAGRRLQPYDLRVTASFGCAEFEGQDTRSTELLAWADKALYAAKRGGRNRVEFSRSETGSSSYDGAASGR